MGILKSNWAVMSIVGMICITPSWLGIGFFQKNFNVRPEVFMIWYFLGVIAGSSCFLGAKGVSLFMPTGVWLAIVLVGITFGSAANMLLFSATPLAPNQGLPAAVASFASVLVFALSLGLYWLLPSYFTNVQVDTYHILGMFLAVAGVILMVMPRS
ncbi:MAG: hypothetical protein U1A23_00830 [Candidatus Sungbacteria bacterium]|nr:hypothetical protein [Candidatus Sungbacteria bacterium]